MRSSFRFVPVVLLLVLGSCATATTETGTFDITTTTISHETTQDILVWSPAAEGPWPIVYALHGLGGQAEDMAVLAAEVASHGVVVFAADYRTDDPQATTRDAECGYRYARSVAADHGGDLDRPVTFVGHSYGATAVLFGGLHEDLFGPDGSYQDCFTGHPMPGAIVAISGCYYEFEGRTSDFDVSSQGNADAHVVLVAGSEDTVCAPWQSRDAATALRDAGYDTELVEIDGANHWTVNFHDQVGDEYPEVPDSPDGHQVVATILEAVDAAQS